MIYLICFDEISSNQVKRTAFTIYKITKSLYVNNLLSKVICLRYDKNLDIPASYILSIRDNILLRLLFKIFNILDRIFPPFNSRYYKEFIFDIYSSRFIEINKDKLIFCTRPLFPHIIKEAKKVGIRTCIRAAVAHPLLNFSLVKNEEVKYGMKSKGSYTNLKRAVRLSKAILETDWLMIAEPEHAKFVRKSYSNFINLNKIITFKSYFGVDKKSSNKKNHLPKKSNHPLSFLHISHINLIKGMPYLFESWRMFMQNQESESKLILVGRVDLNIKKIYRDFFYNLPNVEFRGFVKNLNSVYNNADVFLCPSISDAGPATILEALSEGLPVICSNNCGFSSLIKDGYNGFTYHFSDVNRLTEIMYWCSKNEDKIYKMGLNAKKSVENFSIENYVEGIVKKLKGLL